MFGTDRSLMGSHQPSLQYTAHIKARGEEAQAIKRQAGFKARRWVVERTHSWMNRFRRILSSVRIHL
jgi:transposase